MNNVLDYVLGDDEGDQNNVDDTFHSENEYLYPLLEGIDSINDSSIAQFVRSILLHADSAFWLSPFHPEEGMCPPDSNLEGGLVNHTDRLWRTASYIAYAHGRDEGDTDYLIAASLLHAVTMYRGDAASIERDSMYPYTIDALVDEAREKFESDGALAGDMNVSNPTYIDEDDLSVILRLVHCHRGMSSPIEETIPVTTLEWDLAIAFAITSNLHFIVDGDNYVKERWLNY